MTDKNAQQALEALKTAKADVARGSFRDVYRRIDMGIAALESAAPSAAEPVALDEQVIRDTARVFFDNEYAGSRWVRWGGTPEQVIAFAKALLGYAVQPEAEMPIKHRKSCGESYFDQLSRED